MPISLYITENEECVTRPLVIALGRRYIAILQKGPSTKIELTIGSKKNH
jgi:hypothetical protein